ncbi:hypothetical protein HYALB_00002776 [Hymenoscyphus albidus]|uniref:Aminotransferase class V domain-containing protein n=1 Tax=Hymenoscyphus albidus TaxID=595503 RepID=A0A9N9LKQ6_9HELO|nr:hypothetical protein HYALB_00002776 [Hymenoscyphus albidus]
MAYNRAVEGFRDREYPMLKNKTYLDHGGTTLYAKSLIEEFSNSMISNLYGNPHSSSDPAQLSSMHVDRTREQALRFFNADPEYFDLVFTANATAAIKLVADSFRDLATSSSTGSFWYGYHKDAHTSLVGVRELTGGDHHYFGSDEEVEEWLDGKFPVSTLGKGEEGEVPGLFAYPGQSNMTGRRLPLSWTGRLRRSPVSAHQNTYSLLDAAALATNCPIDFSNPDTAPDFTVVSFYKIFGFPDLGALIVRRSSAHILSWRKYFGGGTVSALTVFPATVQRKDTTIHDALEDGTLPFHNIIALGCALRVHKRLFGSMKMISRHTTFLAQRLYQGMLALHHLNGRPLCDFYNDNPDCSPYSVPKNQGATVAFNIIGADGTYIAHSLVESLANEKQIFLRSGGLCNPGGVASYLKVEPWQFKRAWSSGYRCGDSRDLEIIHGKPMGVVRASLGAMTTIADVDNFLTFLAETFLQPTQDLTIRDISLDEGIALVDESPKEAHLQIRNKQAGYLPKHVRRAVVPDQTPNIPLEKIYSPTGSETFILSPYCPPKGPTTSVGSKAITELNGTSMPPSRRLSRPLKTKLLSWKSMTSLREHVSAR